MGKFAENLNLGKRVLPPTRPELHNAPDASIINSFWNYIVLYNVVKKKKKVENTSAVKS